MAYTVTFAKDLRGNSGPIKQQDGTYQTVIESDSTPGVNYVVVSPLSTDSSIQGAIKALCAKRHKSNVACFCGFKPVEAPAKTLTVN